MVAGVLVIVLVIALDVFLSIILVVAAVVAIVAVLLACSGSQSNLVSTCYLGNCCRLERRLRNMLAIKLLWDWAGLFSIFQALL